MIVWYGAIKDHIAKIAQVTPQNLRLFTGKNLPRTLDTPRQGHKFHPGARLFWDKIQ